jgi:ferric-dicitrate binding protein FerR (iron transport regulator)
MNDPNLERLTDDERRVRDAVRGLGVPEARPGYRANLRAAFAGGSIAAPSRPIVPLPQRPWMRWALVPAAAAAVFLIAGALNRPPAWRVTAVSGEGIAVVDGKPVNLAHRDELQQRVRQGARVVLPEGAEIELTSSHMMVVQITPGTEAVVPVLPGRWWGREVDGALASGEVRITTGRDFRGARLALETPEADVEVTGTTLAVIREPVGTCVCVFDGHVMVGPRDPMIEGGIAVIEPGQRRFVFNDGRPMEDAEMRPMEKVKLGEMRGAKARAMGME